MSKQFNSVFLFVVALASLAALVAAGPCAAEWTVTDLGVLDGFTYSRAADVNTSGQVVGDSFNGTPGDPDSTTASQAFVWESDTGMVALPTLDGYANSFAVAINASGQIAGTCWNDEYCCDCTSQACLWEYDPDTTTWQVTGLGYLESNSGSVATAINDSGQVVVHSIGAPNYSCGGAFWDNGTLTAMTAEGGSPIWPDALNASGQVTGQHCCASPRTSVIWAAGATTILAPDADSGEGYSINSQGEVVGGLWSGGEMFHFLWLPASAYGLLPGLHTAPRDPSALSDNMSAINDGGQTLESRQYSSATSGRSLTDLTLRDLTAELTLATATVPRSYTFDSSYPGKMNASGEVAGGCDHPFIGGGYAGYYLSADTGHSYLPSLSGAVLDAYTWANAIDDAGHIVGFSSPAEGEVHAALWTGTPPTNSAPVLDSLPAGLTGVAGHEVTFAATASDPDLGDDSFLRFSLVDAPEGATINVWTGGFSWTPTADGTYEFGVSVTDGELSDSGTVSVTVGANQPPTLTVSPTTYTTAVGQAVTFTATATDPESDPLTFSLTGAPADATIDATTGEFSWVPTEPGDFSFTVRASDASGSDTETVTVHVTALSVSSVTLSRNRRGIVVATVTITNATASTIANVRVTAATLGGIVSSSRLPLSLARNMRASTSKTCKLQFVEVPAGSATFTLNGTSSAGAFSTTQDVTVP